MSADTKQKRVELSLPLPIYRIIFRAAERRGMSLSAFLTACARETAIKDETVPAAVWEPVGTIVLSEASGEAFARAWDNDPTPDKTVRNARRTAAAMKDVHPDPKDLF